MREKNIHTRSATHNTTKRWIKFASGIIVVMILIGSVFVWHALKENKDLTGGSSTPYATLLCIRGDRLKNNNLNNTLQALEIVFYVSCFRINISDVFMKVFVDSIPIYKGNVQSLACWFDNGNIGDIIDASCIGSRPYNRTYETNYVAHAISDKDHSFDDGDLVNDAEDRHIINDIGEQGMVTDVDMIKVIINISEERQSVFSLTSDKYIDVDICYKPNGGALAMYSGIVPDFTNSSERYVNIWGEMPVTEYPRVFKLVNITGDRCNDSNPNNNIDESIRVFELVLELNQSAMAYYGLEKINFDNLTFIVIVYGNYTIPYPGEGTVSVNYTNSGFSFDNGEVGCVINATTEHLLHYPHFVAYSIYDPDHSFDNGDEINDITDNHTMNENDIVKVIINLNKGAWPSEPHLLPDTLFGISVFASPRGFAFKLKTPSEYTGRYVYIETLV